MTFPAFFQTATHHSPHGYQTRLACGEPTAGVPHGVNPVGCRSRLISIPTGLGKTAAVTLAWLWNRVAPGSPGSATGRWPRRLIYCLPMRVLVEQTANSIEAWLGNLRESAAELGLSPAAQAELDWLHEHSPVVLMGGEEPDRDWDLHPERPAIVLGTQDMLLSRALNRGYGMSRYRWPIHFGLLNNDCLWVLDETQLMGVGLDTSVQLAGLRERFSTFGAVAWWMSATPDARRLRTPEAPPAPTPFELETGELAHPEVARRRNARKRVQPATTRPDDPKTWATRLAREILDAHVSGSLTLVVLNQVERAQNVFRALRATSDAPELLLLHGRFRPHDREPRVRRLLDGQTNRIVIATQVVEAGVDVSARTLFTELAPWSSLVQRFGRCHRHGEMTDSGADIRWLDVPDDAPEPYAAEEIACARGLLNGLEDASPASLAGVVSPVMPDPPRHLLRPKDLRELFDTTPDIGGADLDVSRFIRDGEETDAQVFWRDAVPDSEGSPHRSELCPVPLSCLNEFARKHQRTHVWVWDTLAARWTHPERFVPGRVYWLHARLGGYDAELGFDRHAKHPVPVVPQPDLSRATPPEGHDQDPGLVAATPRLLADHTADVVQDMRALAEVLSLDPILVDTLLAAALWHDVGKAHPAFQSALRRAHPGLAPDQVWAKSGSRAVLDFGERRRFRHELASALTFLERDTSPEPWHSLAAYLVAAHHGKIRLSIRSLPDEEPPPTAADGTDPLYARGIRDGDGLPALEIGGLVCPETRLNLGCMQLGLGPDGRPSWLERCLALRDAPELGPFRLAYLETLLRAADVRASRRG